MSPEHSAEGEYDQTYTLDDVYEAFEQVPAPVYTTSDVVDALGCSRHTAQPKLQELYDRGRLNHHETAGRTVYWPAGETLDVDFDALADVMLSHLSTEIGQPLILGDHTVYEDGDRHAVESSDDSM